MSKKNLESLLKQFSIKVMRILFPPLMCSVFLLAFFPNAYEPYDVISFVFVHSYDVGKVLGVVP
jgi:hypothetical protein